MNLDIKDKKILYELEKDARISNSELSKKILLSKDAVGYRIKQLEEKGLIRGYRAIIDVNKIGYSFFRVYLKLIDTTEECLKEMIEYLKKEKMSWWIARLDGSWDFLFACHAKSNIEFHDFYFKFQTKFRKNIKEKLICPIIYYKELPRKYLTESKDLVTIEQSNNIASIDEKDKHILEILSNNAKTHSLDISKKVGIDIKTLRNKIKRLENEKVILGYKADLDVSKLGRDFYTVEIDLNNYSKYNEIRNEIFSLKELTSWVISIGGYDVEFDLEIENTKRYYEIINQLKNKFSEIREVRYFRVIENYKIVYLPQD